MKPTETPITASVLARLQSEAKRTGESYNAVLGRFVGFRLLYRLSKSSFTDQFLLKGAYVNPDVNSRRRKMALGRHDRAKIG